MSRFLAFDRRTASVKDESHTRAATTHAIGAAGADGADGLLSFETEGGLPLAPSRGRSVLRNAVLGLSAICVLAATTAVSVAYFETQRKPALPAPATPVASGVATFDSRPPGAEIAIDGVVRGITPIKLTLAAGRHQLDIRSGPTKRSLPLVVHAGAAVSQYVEFAEAAVVSAGRLEITSEPAGAQVTIDGSPRGATPLTIAAIAVGEHSVAISNGDTTIRRTVTIGAGATATVVASLAGAANAAGWMAVKIPFEVQIWEADQLIGTSGVDRLMLSAGRHELELANPSLEFQAAITVQILRGKTATPTVAVPNGSLSINALPWADVWIDGRPAGTTPIGNLALPIGTHEIAWRHPQLGDRRRTVSVTATSPVRVGIDFGK